MNDDTLLHIMMRQHGSFPNYFSDILSLLGSDEIVSLLTSRNKQGENPIDFVLNATGAKSIPWVGHSQGTLIPFVHSAITKTDKVCLSYFIMLHVYYICPISFFAGND